MPSKLCPAVCVSQFQEHLASTHELVHPDLCPSRHGALLRPTLRAFHALSYRLDSPAKIHADDSLVLPLPKAVPYQGSPSILLSELVLWVALSGVGPGTTHQCCTISWGDPGMLSLELEDQVMICCVIFGQANSDHKFIFQTI